MYLKTFSGKKGNNNLLADFLNADGLLKSKKEGKKKIVYKSNSTKLYYKVLDILHQYHLNSELLLLNEEELNIKRSKILYSKGFYNEADKLISKVIARSHENNRLSKIEAIELKLQHAINKGDVNYLSEQFNDDKTKLLNYFNEYYNIIEYESLWAMLKLETVTSFFYSKLHDDKSFNYSKLLSDESMALTPRARTIYYKIKGFLAIKNNDVKSALEFTLLSINVFETHPNLLRSEPAEYLKAIRNLCISYKFNNEIHKALAVLQKIQTNDPIQLHNTKAEVQIEYFFLFVILKLDLMINSGQFKNIEPELKMLEKKYKDMEEILPTEEKITAVFHFSLINIQLGYTRKALRYNNYVKEHAGIIRKDLYHIALMNEFVIHFQLNNLQLLESKINAFKRFISETVPVFGFEKKLPELFTMIANNPEKTSGYEHLHAEILTSLKKENKMVYEKFIPFLYLKKKPDLGNNYLLS